MPGIDKANFLKRISEKPPAGYGDEVPGAPGESGEGALTCGEQLLAAVKANDAAGIDAALKEAASKYAPR